MIYAFFIIIYIHETVAAP